MSLEFYEWLAGNAAALSLGPVGPAGVYNKFNITAPKCVYTKVGEGDRSGIQTGDLDFQCCINAGDDEFKLEFVK